MTEYSSVKKEGIVQILFLSLLSSITLLLLSSVLTNNIIVQHLTSIRSTQRERSGEKEKEDTERSSQTEKVSPHNHILNACQDEIVQF